MFKKDVCEARVWLCSLMLNRLLFAYYYMWVQSHTLIADADAAAVSAMKCADVVSTLFLVSFCVKLFHQVEALGNMYWF